MKNKQQITEAVERFKQNQSKTSRYNHFGDDKHEAIDAIINVLQNNMDYDEIENEYIEGYVYDAANSAREWIDDDDLDISDLLYPENL